MKWFRHSISRNIYPKLYLSNVFTVVKSLKVVSFLDNLWLLSWPYINYRRVTLWHLLKDGMGK